MSPLRKRVLAILAGTIGVAAFFALSSIAIVWANGLRYNPDTNRFEPTAMLAVRYSSEVEAAVYVNGELVDSKVPTELRQLPPGYYELLVKRDGYNSFRKMFQLSAGEVGLLKDVKFIAELPAVSDETDTPTFNEPYFEVGLTLSDDGELLDNGKLISRFVELPVLARRYQGGYLYQIGDQLRIVFIDGPQDYLIYRLPNREPANIVIDNFGRDIVLNEGATAKRIRPLVPNEPSVELPVTAR